MKALPRRRTRDYTEYVVPVTSASTIAVRCVSYTVPSRLIGERLRVHVYDDRLCAYVGSSLAIELPRVYPLPGKRRARRVDYRHVIESLVKKPRAFKNSVMRNELLPSASYQRAYQAFVQHLDTVGACKLIVGTLAIAPRHDCEAALGAHLDQVLGADQLPTLVELERKFGPSRAAPPAVVVKQHSLSAYNALCPSVAEVSHV